jgi:hypothetical protein
VFREATISVAAVLGKAVNGMLGIVVHGTPSWSRNVNIFSPLF